MPTWGLLHRFCDDSNLTRDGKVAVGQILDRLEERLGRAWPQRLWAAHQRLHTELLWFSANVLALHRFVTFAVQLEAVADAASFAPVLRIMKRQPNVTDWYHTKLQLEVARVAKSAGWGVVFEPSIPGSVKRGDLLLSVGTGSEELVETTTLFRAREDLLSESFGEEVQARVAGIERQHAVHAVIDLIERIEPEAIEEWLERIEQAAKEVRATGAAQAVDSAAGRVSVQKEPIALRTDVFSGIANQRDAVYRFGAAVAGKAAQSQGPYPAWLRIDARDGLFGFTEWSRMPSGERISRLAAVVRPYIQGHDHLHGIVCSSGALPVWGTVDPSVADERAQTRDGHFVRALIAPHLARETVVVTLRTSGAGVAEEWACAYASEADWLDRDLAALGLPPLAAFWPRTS